MKRKKHGTNAFLICVSIIIWLVSSPAFAQTAPTLDGFLDDVYKSHGTSIDYAGFYPQARAVLYFIDDDVMDPDYIWIAWVITTDFNDNTYGTGEHLSWTLGGHIFFDLYESDKQRLDIENSCGETVFDATMDLLDEVASYPTPSGYDAAFNTTEDSEQIYINTYSGADWSSTYVDYSTSLAGNLNDLGYCIPDCSTGGTNILVNSPPFLDEANYVFTAAYADWEPHLIWEIKLHRDVFKTAACPGGGILGIATNPVELHASPSKIGVSPVTLFKVVSSIGDYIWLDANRDGIQDVTETGIGNVTVDIYNDANENGVVDAGDGYLYTTTTDSYGRYLFRNLGTGKYVVDVTDTNGILTGLSPTTGTTDPHGTIDLGADSRYLDADFGYAPAASLGAIGDYVWSDADNDGIQDPGEPGIGNVTIDLLGDDGFGNFTVVLDSTTTRDDGSYLFTGLAPDYYVVDVTDTNNELTGYTLTVGPQSRTDPSDVISLQTGEVYLNADFGYYMAGLGTIGNQIWFEEDGDGLYEPANGETGIADVTVDLYKDTNGNGVWDVEDFVISSITATDGTYQFTGLALDDGGGDGDFDYFVHVSDTHDVLGRYRKSTGTAGLDDNSQVDPYHVELSAASPSNQTADFGYWFDKVNGIVGDYVWYDLNGDGVQDDGEPGIAGVVVELYTLKNGNLDVKQGEITTDVNGKYYFPNLATKKNGQAYAIVVHADNFLAGGALYGFTATNQPDHQDESVGLTDTVTEDLTLDFGYRKDPTGGTYTIGDYIWLDRDGEGDQDIGEEIVFENVTIDLYDDLNGNGVIDPGEPVIATTVTDDTPLDTVPTGNYHFSGLPDGDYIVQITDDFGILDGYTKTAGTDNWPVTINGASNLNIDYGYFRDDPTLAFVAPFHAYGSGGRAVVHWETTAENGTIGFNLLRQVKETGQYRRVNNHMLPGLQNSIRGGIYRFVDDEAQPGGTYTYKLEEIEATGKRVHGPFEVTVGLKGFDYHTRPELKPLRGNYGAQPHPVPEARKARLRLRSLTANAAKLQKKARAGDALKIAVREKGFYFVDAAAIAQVLGVSQNKIGTGIRNRNLLLTNRGQAVTYIPAKGNSGLYFYGEDIDSIYTGENIYWLTKGKGAGLEYDSGGLPAPGNSDDTFIDTLHIEKDKYALTAIYNDPEADYWLWDFVYGGQNGKAFDFHSPGAAGYGTALLKMNLKGATNTPALVDHHIKVSLNGTYIGESQWDGIDSYSFDIYFEPSLLYEGGNILKVSAVLNDGVPYSVVHVDSFDLSYRRLYRAVNDRLLCRGGDNPVITVEGFTSPNIKVFDVTDPKRPKLITGTSIDSANRVSFIPAGPDNLYYALSPNGLYNPLSLTADKTSYLKKRRNRAEYVVIAPEGLEAAAKDLADLRQNRGLETMVVELEDIYDEFNYGIATPAAIKDFLTYAYRKWNGSGLKYVVLAGEGTYDYKNNLGNGGCLVPPLMAATPYGLFASDNRFGDVVGNDGVPEIAVGRLPVLTGAELQSYINKMTDYEGSAGAWTGKVMMMADDPDEGGNFPVDSDYLSTLFPLYNVDKIYLPHFSTIDEARQQALSGFNEGALLVNYIGHSGLNRLAKEGLLLTSDVAALQNGDRLPLLTAFTCLVGRYEIPNYDSLSEELVLKNNGGAAAVWAPTGASLNAQARILAAELFKALFQGQDRVLGNAVVTAMQKYALTYGSEPFMLHIYNLLGDPALEIK